MSAIAGCKRSRPASCEDVGTPQTARPFRSDEVASSLSLDLIARIGSYLPFEEAKTFPLFSKPPVSIPSEDLGKPIRIFYLVKLCVESTLQLKISTIIKLFDHCKRLRLEDQARILINSVHSGLFDLIPSASQQSIPLAQLDPLDSLTPTPYEEIVNICLAYGYSEKLLEILSYPQSSLLNDEKLEGIAYHAVKTGSKPLLQAILKRRFEDSWCKWQLIPILVINSVLFNQRALFNELSAHPIIADGKFPKDLLIHAVNGASKEFVLDLLSDPVFYQIDSDDIAKSLCLAIEKKREDVVYELLFHPMNTSSIRDAFFQACTLSPWVLIQKILSHPLKPSLSYSDIAFGCRLLARRAEISNVINLIYNQGESWSGLFAASIDEWILLIARNENPDLKKNYSQLFKFLLKQGGLHLPKEFFYKLFTRAIETAGFSKGDFDILWKAYPIPSSIPLETYFYFCDLAFMKDRSDLKLWEIDSRFTLPLFARWCEDHKGSPQSDRFIASQVAAPAAAGLG